MLLFFFPENAIELLEILAVFSSMAYVILAARSSIWCWLFGFMSSALYLAIFIEVSLFSDAILQVYYCGMSIYGWSVWNRQKTKQKGDTNRGIIVLPWSRHVLLIAIGFMLSFFLGFFWTFFDASLPYLDAFTTSFAILTTILVARRVLENWIYWIVIDLVSTGIYAYKGLYPTAGLFVVYTIIAVYGFIRWKKEMGPAS